MKTSVFIIAIALLFACCKSKEKLMTSEAGHLTGEAVDVVVKEEVQDTLTIDLHPLNPRPENVKLTKGDGMMRYCIIVGSFMYEKNADNLRYKLSEMGFLGTSIMRNEQGMYRVSALCGDELSSMQSRLLDIRRRYPQFSDAWLLQVEE